MTPAIMDAAGWAQLLQCSQKTVEERMRTGDLPGEKFGEGWVCPAQAMLDRLNEIAVEKMFERRAVRERPAAPTLVAVRGKRTRQLPASLQQALG